MICARPAATTARTSPTSTTLLPRTGSGTGASGDGQSRGELLPMMFGDEIVRAFGELKAAFDPGQPNEPGQGRRPLPAGRESDAAGLVPPRTRHVLQLPAGRRLVRRGGGPLRGS